MLAKKMDKLKVNEEKKEERKDEKKEALKQETEVKRPRKGKKVKPKKEEKKVNDDDEWEDEEDENGVKISELLAELTINDKPSKPIIVPAKEDEKK